MKIINNMNEGWEAFKECLKDIQITPKYNFGVKEAEDKVKEILFQLGQNLYWSKEDEIFLYGKMHKSIKERQDYLTKVMIRQLVNPEEGIR